jgi:hypothetical protein
METGPEERLLQLRLFAHWQLEVHGRVFDITKTGSWPNSQLRYNGPTLAVDDARAVFDTKNIGTTSLSWVEVHEMGRY